MSDFAHITSHNLRAPIANLSILRDLYLESENTDDKAVIFDKLSQSVNNLNTTLNELVDALLIKSMAGTVMRTISLQKALNFALSSLSEVIVQNKARIDTDLAVEKIYGTRQYWESILLNLISNSIRYRKIDSSLEIFIKSWEDTENTYLSVKDNGLGIDMKRHGSKLFGLHKTFHRNSDAKGVGLFMTKTQVEAMGGQIHVKSAPNEGAEFIIMFQKRDINKNSTTK